MPNRLSRATGWLFAALLGAAAGCQWHPPVVPPSPLPPSVALLNNPLLVAAADREFLWNQLIDTVDDYFPIQREERVRLVGDVLIEGRIETLPTDGASLLEPWRKDSTPGFERLHATLQSVRRRAVVRVIPTDGGYLVDVAVYKDLEDVPRRPLVAAAGATPNPHLLGEPGPRPAAGRKSAAPAACTWIPQGRDAALEQRILGEFQSRLAVR